MRKEPPKYFNHLRYRTRLRLFFRLRWKRFAFVGLFFMVFNYFANFTGFFTARIERSFRKYKKQHILKKHPKLITYESALETQYKSTKLSQQSFDRLAEAFLKLDRQLKTGMSRQLIINAFSKVTTI